MISNLVKAILFYFKREGEEFLYRLFPELERCGVKVFKTTLKGDMQTSYTLPLK